MKQLPTRRFVSTLAGCLIAAVAVGEGCGKTTRGPTAPSGPTNTYAVSGTISEFRGGPLGAVSVIASARQGSASATTVTDAQGRYRLSSQFSGNVDLVVYKTGYMSAWKYTLSPSPPESTVDFVLHPSVEVSANGDMLSGVVRGDEYLAGDDVLFGGLCTQAPCKILHFKESPAPNVEVRLRLVSPGTQPGAVGDGSTRLALYVTRENLESGGPPFQPPDRRCCSYSSNEPVVATFGVPSLGYIAIAYELEEGRPPGSADGEPFELTIRRTP